MPTISLTDFVDIVSKSGTPKITKVAQVKNRAVYSPQTDFYKIIRDAIVEAHQRDLAKSHLRETIARLTDQKKITNYPDVTAGYVKWWGKKQLEWFPPPSAVFSAHGIDVKINPELGLLVNGTPHVIKLYFKGEALTKSKVHVAAHLMEIALRDKCSQGARMSVLDTRQGKLITPEVPIERLTAGLDAELAYIAAIWPRL